MIDPITFKNKLFPTIYFYKQQKEIIYSTLDNYETYCVAANATGKDFVAGFIALYFFLTRNPCRIIITSAKEDHLSVLFGEIKNFISICKYPLPLVVNHREIKKYYRGQVEPKSYIKGMVSSPDRIAAMQGHHIPRSDNVPKTLFIADECSSVPHSYWEMATTWSHRMLLIGNAWTCNNFFYFAVNGRPGTDDVGGDIPGLRKIIKIKAEDSPNVRLARQEIKKGKKPSNKILVPGVRSYEDLLKYRRIWSKTQQRVSLDAEFVEDETELLTPHEWLQLAINNSKIKRNIIPRTLGVDVSFGGDDNSAFAISGDLGLIYLEKIKTIDTNLVITNTIKLIKEYKLDPKDVYMDSGGGGNIYIQTLRRQGFKVNAVNFGEAASKLDIQPRGLVLSTKERKEISEQKPLYKNRRAELYGLLRDRLNPNLEYNYSIPQEFMKLLYPELIKIPLLYDGEGKMYMLPKRRKSGSKEQCLIDLIGHSPDAADAFVLAIYGLNKKKRTKAGAV